MSTLPTMTRTVNDAFTRTWYKIREKAIDNILTARVVWSALKAKGCFKTQVGEDRITDTILHGTIDAVEAQKGQTFEASEPDLYTMMWMPWSHTVVPLYRAMIGTNSDQENRGANKIGDLVKDRIRAGREGLLTRFETDLVKAQISDESLHVFRSFKDMVPDYDDRATGTYGNVSRTNTWWQPIYAEYTGTPAVNFLADWRSLYNSIGLNVEYPDLVVTSQLWWEYYEDTVAGTIQIAKDDGKFSADLGFQTFKFKGADVIWDPQMNDDTTASSNEPVTRMHTTSKIKVTYDPGYWFEMTGWKEAASELERQAQILCTKQMHCNELRRQGAIYKP